MKETEDDTNRWKDIACLWIGRTSIIKRPYYPRQCRGSMQSLSKCHCNFSQNYNNSKICMDPQKTPNSQRNLEKEEQSLKYQYP